MSDHLTAIFQSFKQNHSIFLRLLADITQEFSRINRLLNSPDKTEKTYERCLRKTVFQQTQCEFLLTQLNNIKNTGESFKELLSKYKQKNSIPIISEYGISFLSSCKKFFWEDHAESYNTICRFLSEYDQNTAIVQKQLAGLEEMKQRCRSKSTEIGLTH